MTDRATIMQRIIAERERQFNLPGREFDGMNTPNDWSAIACSYVSDGIGRNHMKLNQADYEDSLVKAAAVIIAALEYVDTMKDKAQFV